MDEQEQDGPEGLSEGQRAEAARRIIERTTFADTPVQFQPLTYRRETSRQFTAYPPWGCWPQPDPKAHIILTGC